MSGAVVSINDCERTFHKSLPPNNTKHTFTEFVTQGLNTEEPTVVISPGEIGLTRIVHAEAHVIGEHGAATWNGDRLNPEFRFDLYPEGKFTFVIEAWGF